MNICSEKNCERKATRLGMCDMHYMRMRRKKLPFRDTEYRYGLSEDEYSAMLTKQGGKCAICQEPEANGKHRMLYVDHDHVTGKVRGLLCPNCNSAIGKLNEDPELFERAVKYLREQEVL